MALLKKVVYVAAFLYVSVCADKLPDFIKLCSRSDPKLKECAVKNGNEAIPHLLKGYKPLNVPPLNPLKITSLEVQTGPNLKLSLKNITIEGFDTLKMTDMDIDLPNKQYRLLFHGKELKLEAIYDIKGQILILPITGSGPAHIKIVDADFEYKSDFTLAKKDGLDYGVISNEKFNYTSGRSYYNLENLFNGNKQLGDQMNKFLNENWKEVSVELGPFISESIGIILHGIIERFSGTIPFDNILTS